MPKNIRIFKVLFPSVTSFPQRQLGILAAATWLQQIVHTLRTHGDMDFDDISRVVPCIEGSARIAVMQVCWSGAAFLNAQISKS